MVSHPARLVFLKDLNQLMKLYSVRANVATAHFDLLRFMIVHQQFPLFLPRLVLDMLQPVRLLAHLSCSALAHHVRVYSNRLCYNVRLLHETGVKQRLQTDNQPVAFRRGQLRQAISCKSQQSPNQNFGPQSHA